MLGQETDRQVHLVANTLSTFCESPIELLLGCTLFGFVNSVAFAPFQSFKALKLGDPDLLGRQPGQYELVPQFVWGKYRIDFALLSDLEYPIFIECDGHDFHERTKEQAARDRSKDRAIQTAGIPILRFTGSEIYQRPANCAHQIFLFAEGRLHPEKVPA